MCGKRLAFLYTSPYEHISFEVPRLNTFVFKKSSEKNIFTIIFVAIRA